MSSNWVCSRSFLSSAASGSSSKQQLGPLDQAAGERHPLALAAGELVRLAPRERGELHQRQGFFHPRRDLGARNLVLAQAEGDVARHRHVGEERVGLEHHVDRPPVGRQRGQIHAVEQEGAIARRLEAREHAEQGGLAAAGGPQQGEELALARYPATRRRPR